MATKIVTKNSSTASAVPTASDLVQGELAVNVADKRLFTEDNGGSIVELGTNPSTIDINAGTIDGTVIGGSSAAAGTFTTGQFNTSVNVNGTVTADGLSVGTTSDAYSQILINSSTTGESELRMGDTDTDAGSIAYTNSNDTMTFRAAAGARMSLNSTGIDVTGTATMDGLSVSGSGTSAIVNISNGIDNTPNRQLAISEKGGSGFIYQLDSTGASGLFGQLAFATNGTERIRIGSGGDVSFYEDTGTTPKFFWDASAESLGIGTSSPATELEVNGDIGIGRAVGGYTFRETVGGGERASIKSNSSNELLFSIGAASEAMRIDSSGNVGIGTSPSTRLHVNGGDGNQIRYSGATHSVAMGITSTDPFVGTITNAPLLFLTNASEKARIDSSGNVGIGTSSPDTLLNLASSSAPTIRIENTDTSLLEGQVVGALEFFSSDPSGKGPNVTGYIETRAADSLGAGGEMVFATGATGSSPEGERAIERMRIDSSGNLLVGRTTPITFGSNTTEGISLKPNRIDMAADSLCRITQLNNSSGTFDRYYIGSGIVGSITGSGTSTSYNTSSDQRLKENIADADDAGSKVDAIQVRKFDWKADGSHQDYGMIAQELQAVAPEAVTGDADSEDMMGVDYSKLVPMLIKEIQSLRNRVAQLEE